MKLLLLDGTALVYRAYFALMRTPLNNSQGIPTGAVMGFANTMLMLVRQESPDYLAVMFDPPSPTFRHEMYPEYKANRSAAPDDLRIQMPLARKLVRAWPCPVIEMEGMEADDVIGSYAAQFASENLEVVMVTGDKDFYQLLSPHVFMLNPGRGGSSPVGAKLLGPGDVEAKFGVPQPSQVVDVLALMGDTSDNVPGVPGVGPKTAGKLIAEHGSLQGLYDHLDAVPQKKLREKLETHRDDAFLARDLVTIRIDLPLEHGVDDLRATPPGGEAWVEVLRELELKNLLAEFDPDPVLDFTSPPSHDSPDTDYVLVDTPDALRDLAAILAASGGFAVDTETTSVRPMTTELVGISVATAPGQAWYVNVSHAAGSPLGVDVVREALGPVLADVGVPKTAHHAKFDLLVLIQAGIPVGGLTYDTMIASYLLDPERSHKLDNLARDRLGHAMIPITDLIGKGAKQITMREVDPVTAAHYAAEDADMTLRLRDVLEPELDATDMVDLFRDVEMPLAEVLLRMEQAGVSVDRDFLAAMGLRLETELARLEKECHDLAEAEFNVNSPKQLAEVLFTRLALTPGKRTKTGFSTDSEVLEKLKSEHDLPGRILEYRQAAKLKSTYVDTLPTMIHPGTGRIHASFNQTVAATGRLSSSDPNLQNIPIRTELGREVRRAFVTGQPDHLLLSADYSQIELRIMAHLSGDPVLCDAFRREEDVHRDTASRIFGVPPDEVTGLQRGQAKTVNFGILYGQGAFGLARTLGISNAEAKVFLEEYKQIYAGVMSYLDSTLEGARELGYVTTILQRRRYLPNLKARGGPARAAAERLAINTPIQGSAADMIKVAMVRLDHEITRRGMASRMVAQVHDELLLEVPRDESDAAGDLVREIMESAMPLDVPVVVNLGLGDNWAEIH